MIRHENFVRPCYDSGGFAGLPQRIQSLVTQYDAVVLFLVDGFGWRFFEKFQSAPFLRQIIGRSQVEKLTSQFPSTTAAHITCIHTGQPVGQSGIYEWTIYDPTLDVLFTPLLFSYAGTQERDQLKPAGVDPKSLYPMGTLHQTLKGKGVEPFVFQHREYTPSTYSNIMFDGATVRGYKTLAEMFHNFGETLKAQKTPAYYFLYYDRVDSLSHDYGPDSPQVEAEIMSFLLLMEHFFVRILTASGKRVLFMLTADHGEVEVDPKTTVYLNTDPRFAGLEKFLKTNKKGELLVPAGAPRDMFLHIKEGLLDEATHFFKSRLADKAEVEKTENLISQGYFGETISPIFRARVGDLVLLPFRYESVWWYEKGKFEQKFYGHHGGLTCQEMEIPLITLEI
jgi:predicted AlkP superfamily pyrophosphatase or phosphodiesterase